MAARDGGCPRTVGRGVFSLIGVASRGIGERAPNVRARSPTRPAQQVGGLKDADERECNDQPAAVDVREERQAYEEHRAGDHAVDERLARLLVGVVEPVDRRAERLEAVLQLWRHSPHRHLRRLTRGC